MMIRSSLFRSLAIIAIGPILGAAVCAATPPPAEPDDEDWEAPVSHKPPTGLMLGQYKVWFEETRLGDVMVTA